MIARTLAALALATTLAAAKDDPLAGRVAGKPVECISNTDADHLTILDRDTLVARFTNRRIWIAHPIGACTQMDPFDTLIVERFGGQLCRNDRFRVLNRGTSIPGPYCRLGAFTPYDKVAGRRR